jgi:hypothetical protein
LNSSQCFDKMRLMEVLRVLREHFSSPPPKNELTRHAKEVTSVINARVADLSRFSHVSVDFNRAGIIEGAGYEPPFSNHDASPSPNMYMTFSGTTAGFGSPLRKAEPFFAKIGAFSTPQGILVQLVPFEWERPVYEREVRAHEATLREFFTRKQLEEVSQLRRINLETIDYSGGTIITHRKHNHRPLGIDFVGIVKDLQAIDPTAQHSTITLSSAGTEEYFWRPVTKANKN